MFAGAVVRSIFGIGRRTTTLFWTLMQRSISNYYSRYIQSVQAKKYFPQFYQPNIMITMITMGYNNVGEENVLIDLPLTTGYDA